MPNKLHELEEAIVQANRLAEVGFWKMFLYVMVVVDSRGRNAGAATYDGLSAREKSMLEPYLRMDKLEARVGFSLLDFTQPMDAIPMMVGSHGMHIRRMPPAPAQSEALTKWVSELFAMWILNQQLDQQNVMSCATSVFLGSSRGLASRCKA